MEEYMKGKEVDKGKAFRIQFPDCSACRHIPLKRYDADNFVFLCEIRPLPNRVSLQNGAIGTVHCDFIGLVVVT